MDFDTSLKGNQSTNNMYLDIINVLRQKNNYILDLIASGINKKSILFDTDLLLRDNESNYSLTTKLFLYYIFIDYAKQTSSSLLNLSNTISSACNIDSEISSIYMITQTQEDVINMINSLTSIFTTTSTPTSLFTLNNSSSNIFTITPTTSSLFTSSVVFTKAQDVVQVVLEAAE